MVQSSGEIIVLTSVLTALAVTAVCLRTWARNITGSLVGPDDWLSYAAVITMIGLISIPLIISCARDNLGNHIKYSAKGEPEPPSYQFNLIQLILEAGNYIPMALAKSSILCFYKRIFRGRALDIIVNSLHSLVILWCIVFFFGALFECTPIPLSLSDPASPKIFCIDFLSFYYAGAVIDLALDLLILAVPGPFVWRLHMPTRQKIAVIFMLMTAAVAIGANVTKLVVFVYAGRKVRAGDPDLTYFVAPTAYWTMIEAASSIVAVCLPSLKPIFHGFSIEGVLKICQPPRSLRSSSSSDDTKKSTEAGSVTMVARPVLVPEEGESEFKWEAGKGDMAEEKPDIPQDGILVQHNIERREELRVPLK